MRSGARAEVAKFLFIVMGVMILVGILAFLTLIAGYKCRAGGRARGRPRYLRDCLCNPDHRFGFAGSEPRSPPKDAAILAGDRRSSRGLIQPSGRFRGETVAVRSRQLSSPAAVAIEPAPKHFRPLLRRLTHRFPPTPPPASAPCRRARLSRIDKRLSRWSPASTASRYSHIRRAWCMASRSFLGNGQTNRNAFVRQSGIPLNGSPGGEVCRPPGLSRGCSVPCLCPQHSDG